MYVQHQQKESRMVRQEMVHIIHCLHYPVPCGPWLVWNMGKSIMYVHCHLCRWLWGHSDLSKGTGGRENQAQSREAGYWSEAPQTYSFFRADFRFSSLTSWLASRSLTSRSERLAGMMSSSRSLLSYTQRDRRRQPGDSLGKQLTRVGGGGGGEK